QPSWGPHFPRSSTGGGRNLFSPPQIKPISSCFPRGKNGQERKSQRDSVVTGKPIRRRPRRSIFVAAAGRFLLPSVWAARVTFDPGKSSSATMKTRLLFILTLLSVLAISATAADITGKWVAQVPGREGQTREQVYNFKADGSALTGTMSGFQGN